jgi:hypothetical protein
VKRARSRCDESSDVHDHVHVDDHDVHVRKYTMPDGHPAHWCFSERRLVYFGRDRASARRASEEY